MNRLGDTKRKLILNLLVEGNSVRAAAGIAKASKNTVIKLLVDAGRACSGYQDRTLRGLPCRRIRRDEIWSFVHAKQKNVPRAVSAPPKAEDVWTWTDESAPTRSWCPLGARASGPATRRLI